MHFIITPIFFIRFRSKDGQSSGRDPGNTSGGGGGQTTLSGGIDFSFNRGKNLIM